MCVLKRKHRFGSDYFWEGIWGRFFTYTHCFFTVSPWPYFRCEFSFLAFAALFVCQVMERSSLISQPCRSSLPFNLLFCRDAPGINLFFCAFLGECPPNGRKLRHKSDVVTRLDNLHKHLHLRRFKAAVKNGTFFFSLSFFSFFCS